MAWGAEGPGIQRQRQLGEVVAGSMVAALFVGAGKSMPYTCSPPTGELHSSFPSTSLSPISARQWSNQRADWICSQPQRLDILQYTSSFSSVRLIESSIYHKNSQFRLLPTCRCGELAAITMLCSVTECLATRHTHSCPHQQAIPPPVYVAA